MKDQYAVIGNPIEHSKSPWIHAKFAEQTGEPIEYGRILGPLGGFVAEAQRFMEAGGRGMNVTVPFKLDAHAFADMLSPRVAAAGAVNTLSFDENGVRGDNTDGVGLVRDIEVNLSVSLKGARILLLGAGGAARGVVLPIFDRAPAALTIVNRTAAKAHQLVNQFAQNATESNVRFNGGGADGAEAGGQYDVVINATAGSLDAALPDCDDNAFGPGTLAYDMMYSPKPTVFMQHAQTFGARAADGLGMLVEQAAESFFIWRGVRPDGDSVLRELRGTLSKN
ncbi:Shikimate 5-dehydrogenase I alpha [Candidatus Burkholderia pumila]|uniref:Shikimate dehydrogenase (NADP(+)) n=1 Tax=Candidatus Burkholderia pumila TaxID=1090375 RepID=A0ABR5HM99_9BURK|nr:Shikimate 5-dehydrogenase I alpha [Candidatus Burkholderia pumila]